MTISNLGSSRFICLHFHTQSVIEGSQVRNSRQEPGGRTWCRSHRKCYFSQSLFLVACSLCFLIASRNRSPGVTPPPGAGLSHINHQLRIYIIGLPTDQSNGDSLPIKVPSSKMTSAPDPLSTWYTNTSLLNHNLSFLVVHKMTY